MRRKSFRLRRRVGFPWWSPAGVGLLVGLVVPILVLAAVSVISIGQRAGTERLLVEERYAAIADLVSTKLGEEMEAWHQELLAALNGEDWGEAAVVSRLHAADQNFAELRPLVMMAAEGRIVYPVRNRGGDEPGAALEFGLGPFAVTQGTYGWLMARAQEAELRDREATTAVRMYRRAVGAAPSVDEHVRALNGLARALLNTGRVDAAIETYGRIVELADPLDMRLGRWAIIARLQVASAETERGDPEAACEAKFETLRFLQRHRFDLDPDVYAFYRAEAQRSLEEHELDEAQHAQFRKILAAEPELEDIDSALKGLLGQVPQLVAANSADWSEKTARLSSAELAAADNEVEPSERPATEWSVTYVNVQQDGTGPTVLSHRQGTDWQLARRWRPTSIKKILGWLVQQDGPWRRSGIGLIDPSGALVYASTSRGPSEHVPARLSVASLPGWRVIAYPRTGSMAAEARQDVLSYSVLLGAAFIAVVASLMLATRTLSREVALARTRTDFVSNVSHELKTPLALIRMFAENLRSGWVPDKKKPEYYEVMLGESERLSSVIENVLDFSRIESGRREYHFHATEVNEVVADIVERYRFSFETSGVTLEMNLPEEPVQARIDRSGIAQVIVNLLSNAAKYIGEDDKRVRVSLGEDGDNVVISVSDTGVGMSRESIEQIFKPFCRIDDPAVESIAGSGIGLTIVRHIVDAHNGSIEVQSEPGRGSTFRVVLPRDPRHPGGAPGREHGTPPPDDGD